jgi:ParB family chromosome partitioning protein
VSKEKRLGRGLEALLGRIPTVPQASEPAEQHPVAAPFAVFNPPVQAPAVIPAPEVPQGPPTKLPVDQIDGNPYQPRRDFAQADIESLAESLEAHGLLQPVVVRKVDERYQVVAGERRLRAAQQAGWHEVPVQVIEADDRQMAELAIVENLHRRDLNALEKAASFQRYLEQYRCTQEELASRLKLDRSTIANLIRLLELPETVQQAVREGRITQGHARALLPLGDEREQMAFCQRIQREELSVRQTESMVQDVIRQADAEPLAIVGRDGEKTRVIRPTSEHVTALEQQFRAALGTKVAIRHSKGGRGKLVIQFRNHEEFERVRQHICGPALPSQAAG